MFLPVLLLFIYDIRYLRKKILIHLKYFCFVIVHPRSSFVCLITHMEIGNGRGGGGGGETEFLWDTLYYKFDFIMGFDFDF